MKRAWFASALAGLLALSSLVQVPFVPAEKAHAETGTPFTGAQHVFTGANYTIVQKTDGSLWGYGLNTNGGIGSASPSQSPSQTVPMYVPNMKSMNLKQIAPGSDHTLFLKQDGTLWASGLNSYGDLGQPTTVTASPYPHIDHVKTMAGGVSHSLAVKEDGTVWAWGRVRKYQPLCLMFTA